MSEKPNSIPGIPDNIPTPADFFGWLNQVMTPLTQAATAMATNLPTPADPLTMWRTYTEKNEEIYSKFLQQLVSTTAFAQTLGRSASATARYRELVKQTAKIYLETADMPSREDVTRLAAQLVALDEKVDNLSDNISDSSDQVPQLVNKVVNTLEALAVRLEKLETQITLQNENLVQISARLQHIEKQVNTPDTASAQITSQLEQISTRLQHVEKQVNTPDTASAQITSRLEQIEKLINQSSPQKSIIEKLDKLEEQLNSLKSSQSTAADTSTLVSPAGETISEPVEQSKPASRSRKKPATTTEPITES